jgi:hypothetical protein
VQTSTVSAAASSALSSATSALVGVSSLSSLLGASVNANTASLSRMLDCTDKGGLLQKSGACEAPFASGVQLTPVGDVCDAARAGTMRYQSSDGSVQVCHSGAWKDVGEPTVYRSCLHIKEATKTNVTGSYVIQRDGKLLQVRVTGLAAASCPPGPSAPLRPA